MDTKQPGIPFSKNKKSALLVVILLIIVGMMFFKNSELKYSLLNYHSIPHIELLNTLYISPNDNLFYGKASGFVTFDNQDNQPRDVRQYYIIEPTHEKDGNSNQIFSLEEIISLYPLPPKNLGKTNLIEKNETSKMLTLEDEGGNQFFINRVSKEISMEDVTGDATKLITNNLDYRSFMMGFLK